MLHKFWVFFILLFSPLVIADQLPNSGNDVRLSLKEYQQLLQAAKRSKASAIDHTIYSINRAEYKGVIIDNTVQWDAQFQVDVMTESATYVALLPTNTNIAEIKIDNDTGTILEQDGVFAVLINSQGRHDIHVVFQSPIIQDQGPPKISMGIPRVPINKIEFQVPGKKELITPFHTNIKHRYFYKNKQRNTSAKFTIPISERLDLSWIEYIPEKIRNQLRFSAEVYHSVYAEEGVLQANANIKLDIVQGDTKRLTMVLPIQAQVNQVSSQQGGILNWTVNNAKNGKQKIVRVYLDHPIKGKYAFQVDYEQLVDQVSIQRYAKTIPLIHVLYTHKQRGMVNLLAGAELLMKPVSTRNIIQVGENQLPATIRESIYKPITHTYKYSAKYPKIRVKTQIPKVQQVKFDSKINTLISLSGDTLKGNSALSIDVKTGSVKELLLTLPLDANLVSIAGPSINDYQTEQIDHTQSIRVKFNKAMQGQFHLAVIYDKLVLNGQDQISVPSLDVPHTNFIHGNIAVEAISALDVSPMVSDQLMVIDATNLPQQLIQKTNNPILLAYKYADNYENHHLALQISRHKSMAVQDTLIANAHYKSLLTNDGLVITKAKFLIKNSKRQFLQMELPKDATLWSVSIDGRQELPAINRTENSIDTKSVLIKLKKSFDGFWLDMVYETPIQKLDSYGTINMNLPVPDLRINETNWDVFLPVGRHYYGVDTNMDIWDRQEFSQPKNRMQSTNGLIAEPHMTSLGSGQVFTMPAQSVHYAFNKLYINQTQDPTTVSIQYASSVGYKFAQRFGVVAVILMWIGLFALRFSKPPLSQSTAYTLLVVGFISLVLTLGYLHAATIIATILAVIGGLIYVYALIMQRRKSIAS